MGPSGSAQPGRWGWVTFRRAFPAPTPTQRRWLELGVLGVALWRVVGVRWTPIVSDDSVGYLTRARAPLGTGFVVDGYRQLGYPLWLWMVDHVASPLGLDRLFGIVVAQRLLLVAAVVALWWVLWLWSAPVLWFVTSATTVVLTNFVLNEGILISLAMLAAAGLLGAASVVAPLTGVSMRIGLAPNRIFSRSSSTMARPKVSRRVSVCRSLLWNTRWIRPRSVT